MGIGAFTYYRRVLDNQKERLLDEIIKVAMAYGAKTNVVSELEAAKNESQFTTAIESIKHALPQVILINGHNPLTLLHDALSSGLHRESDETCLSYAQNIRIVLMALAENITFALKDKSQLQNAIVALAKKKASKKKPKREDG